MDRKTWILVLLIGGIYVDGLSTTSDRVERKLFGGYRITPKFCRASKTLPRSDPRSHGPTICMFNHECTQRQGEVVGACMDGFLFGACCQLQGDIDTTLVHNVDEAYYITHSPAAASYQSYVNQQTNNLGSGNYNEINLDESYPSKTDSGSSNVVSNGYETSDNVESSINHDKVQNNIYLSNIKATSNPSSNQFYVDTGSVIVTASSVDHKSTLTMATPTQQSSLQNDETNHESMYFPPSSAESLLESSPEIPVQIHTGPYESSYDAVEGFTSDAFNQNANTNAINSQSMDFTHSDITHPGFDAVVLDEKNGTDSVAPISSSTERASTVMMASTDRVAASTPKPVMKVTYAKPAFKPKTKPTMPTKTNSQLNNDDFVLVQTISNNKTETMDSSMRPPSSMSENDIESIESIILMLNDTKTGPQYNAAAAAAAVATEPPMDDYSDTTANSNTPIIYSTENYIDFNKYGPNSYFITTKIPSESETLATANYVYSPRPEIRPQPLADAVYNHPGILNGYGVAEPEIIVNKIAMTSPAPATPIPVYHEDAHTHHIKQTLPPITHRPTFVAPLQSTAKPVVTSTTAKKPTTNKKPKRPVTKTTKKPPSTSYVTGPTTVRPVRPSASPTTKPQNAAADPARYPVNLVSSTPSPLLSDTYSSTPTVIVLGPTYSDYFSSTEGIPMEHVIQSKPSEQHPPSLVHVQHEQNIGVPSPTVHITPKPTVNLVTSSTWTHKPTIINKNTVVPGRPSTPQYMYRPAIQSSTAGYVSTLGYGPSVNYGTSPGYGPSIHYGTSPGYGPSLSNYGTSPGFVQKQPVNQYQEVSYFGGLPTRRPIITQNMVTPIYNGAPAVYSSPSPYPGYFGSTAAYDHNNIIQQQQLQQHEPVKQQSNINDDYFTSSNDMNNFPPVRNPNLNMSAMGGITIDDYDMSTPHFIEDDALNEKMDSLVNKIVESLQGNFEDLADVVYKDAKNTTTNKQQDPASKPSATVKPVPIASTTTTRRPIHRTTTKKPVARPGSPATSVSSSNVRPVAAASAAAGAAGAGATKPTVRPVSTKKPAIKVSTTTRRPFITRRTTRKPTTILSTTKKSATRITTIPTTTTRRPTTRPTKKIAQTTVIQQDDDGGSDDIEEEETDEDNEISDESNDEQTTPAFGEGRIQCGVRPLVKSARIVGGKASQFGEFPWQVLVRESTWLGLFTKNKCGGVLITKNFVITAAHCQPGFLASLVTVFGEFDISGDLETQRSVTKNVKRVVVHREYDAATFENDLALLELESPIHYDTHIVPICMPPDVADFTGRMATVTGWGRLKYGGGVPSVLQEVQVPIMENSVCQEMFHTAGHNKKILPSFLCAGYANGQKDSCEGDSGGPLVLQRPDGRWELAGTVSHGIKCAAPYLPGVYMRTTYYKPWLQSVTGVH